MVSGTSGAIGSIITYNLLKYFKLKKERNILKKNNFLVDEEELLEQRAKSYLTKIQYFINLDSTIELYFVLRGIIAGIVSILISPSNYYTYTAFISGFIAGAAYMFSIRIFHGAEIDDCTSVSSTHFIIPIFSIVSIFLFHKQNGLFY